MQRTKSSNLIISVTFYHKHQDDCQQLFCYSPWPEEDDDKLQMSLINYNIDCWSIQIVHSQSTPRSQLWAAISCLFRLDLSRINLLRKVQLSRYQLGIKVDSNKIHSRCPQLFQMLKGILLLALMALLVQTVDFIQPNDVVHFSEEDTQTIMENSLTLISALRYQGKLIYPVPLAKNTLSTNVDPYKVTLMMRRSLGFGKLNHNGIMTICREDPETGVLYITLDPWDLGFQWIVYGLDGKLLYFADSQYNPVTVKDTPSTIGAETQRSTAKCYVRAAELLLKIGIDDPSLFCQSAKAKRTALLDLYRTEIECFSEEEKVSQPVKLEILKVLQLLTIQKFRGQLIRRRGW